VYTVSRQYAQEGLERVLNRKKRETPPVPAKVTGDIEANKPPRMGAGKIQTAGTAMCAVKGETREEAPDTDLGLYSGEYRVLIGSFNAVGGLYGQYQGT
jgi:hypothetical protein